MGASAANKPKGTLEQKFNETTLRSLFTQLDTDKSGRISFDNLRAGQQQVGSGQQTALGELISNWEVIDGM